MGFGVCGSAARGDRVQATSEWTQRPCDRISSACSSLISLFQSSLKRISRVPGRRRWPRPPANIPPNRNGSEHGGKPAPASCASACAIPTWNPLGVWLLILNPRCGGPCCSAFVIIVEKRPFLFIAAKCCIEILDVHRHWQMFVVIGRCSSSLADVRRHWQMFVVFGRCSSSLADVHRHWQMFVVFGKCSSSLANVHRLWQMFDCKTQNCSALIIFICQSSNISRNRHCCAANVNVCLNYRLLSNNAKSFTAFLIVVETS